MGVIAFLVVGIVIYSIKTSTPRNMLEVNGFYDANGNKIVTSLAVVNGVEGVQYISFDINALNKDTVPLDFEIVSLSPVEFQEGVESSMITADPNNYATWTSGLIDIGGFVGTTQTFEVSITASSPGLRESITKTANIILTIDPNPTSNFDIEFYSSVGESAEIPQTTLPFGIPDLSIYDPIYRVAVSRNIGGQMSYENSLILDSYDQMVLEIFYDGKDGVSAGEFGGTFAIIYPTEIFEVTCFFDGSSISLPNDLFGTTIQTEPGKTYKSFSYGVTDGTDIPFDGDSQSLKSIDCHIENGDYAVASGQELKFIFIPAGYYLNSNNEYVLDTQKENGEFIMDFQPSINTYFGN